MTGRDAARDNTGSRKDAGQGRDAARDELAEIIAKSASANPGDNLSHWANDWLDVADAIIARGYRRSSQAIAHLYEARREAYELSQRAAVQAAIGLAPDLRVSTGQAELMGIYSQISAAIQLLEAS